MMRAALLFLLAAVIGLLPVTDRMVLAQQSGQPVPPQAAPQATPTQVPVRGGLHEGYGRLVFDWPGSVDYTAAVEDGSLVIQFDRPLRADLSGALANLRSFLAGGSLEPDGRTLSFVLANGDFGLRSFKIGTSVVLDLLRQGGAETASAPPPPSPLPASTDIPSLQVRGADHEGYSRLVFDWNQPVDYTVDNRNGQATLRFDRPASFETGTLNSRPLRNVRRVEPTGNDSRGMTLQIPSDARLRHFRSGTRIVVDVLNPASEATAGAQQAAPQQAAAPTPAPKPPAGERSQSQAPAQPPQQQAQAPAQPSAQPSGQPPARPAGTRGPALPAQPVAPVIAEPTAEAGPVTGAAPQSGPQSGPQSADRIMPTQPLASSLSPQRIRAPVPLEQLQGTPVPVTLRREGDLVALRFQFEDANAAAVFRRAAHLWIVFDGARRFDFSAISESDAGIFSELTQLPVPNGSAARARLVPGINPRIWRDGPTWVIELRAQPLRPDVALNTEMQPVSPQGPRLFIPVTGIGETTVVRDPEVGDELHIVPLSMLGRGIEGDRRFAEFELLATVQGIAVVPLADGVAVRQLPDGVAITGGDGLVLSRDLPERSDTFGEVASDSDIRSGKPFSMLEWRGNQAPGQGFYPKRQQLQFALADATSIARTKPRMDLARFYFANGLAPEATGLLRVIAEGDSDYANLPSFKALRGATQFMMGRHQDALNDLSDRALDGIREVALWRGAAYAALGKWNEAVEQFARAGEIPADYPRNFTTEIALLAAQAAIRVGDNRGAGQFLNVVAAGAPTDSEQARINYLRGRVLQATGDTDAAFDLWRPLAEGADRWARVRAARAVIEEELAQEKISNADALQRLESLRFAWRGDELEFDLLRRLGDLYLAENDYRNGLATLREAATLFPDHPETPTLARTMTDAFAKLYLEGGAERMPPLTALALYDDFRELTPPGARGNEMIQRLADRLVTVDLLDRAANLLDRQVKFRLEGVEKARIGARLALIRLLDRRPEAAVGALDESAVPGIPVDLARERNRLRARAQFDLGNPDQAIALLQPDTSREADLLRADILWRQQDWAGAAEVFTRLAEPLADKRDLTEREATLVLNWAISASMSEDTPAVVLIRQNYAQAMDDTRFREAFRLITNTTSGDLNDLRTLTQRFQEVERFQSFLSDYRERLKASQLSAIN
jgi:tetratricopeptide (TPR) repeat protein